MKELTKEDIKGYTGRGHHLTVRDLKKFLEEHNLPDDAPVVVQRVEDVYYEKHGWGVYLKGGYWYNYAKRWNDDIDSGKYLDEEQYPLMKGKELEKISDEDMKKDMEQYHPAFCCVWYKDDQDILFLDLHY